MQKFAAREYGNNNFKQNCCNQIGIEINLQCLIDVYQLLLMYTSFLLIFSTQKGLNDWEKLAQESNSGPEAWEHKNWRLTVLLTVHAYILVALFLLNIKNKSMQWYKIYIPIANFYFILQFCNQTTTCIWPCILININLIDHRLSQQGVWDSGKSTAKFQFCGNDFSFDIRIHIWISRNEICILFAIWKMNDIY